MAHAPPTRLLTVTVEKWSLARPFVISRGTKTHADVVVVKVDDGSAVGRGEAVPYARYGESVDSVVSTLNTVDRSISRAALCDTLPPGAARNALDCALWDLEAKAKGIRAFELAEVKKPTRVQTAFTISLGSPDSMASQAVLSSGLELLKLKLGGGDEDIARMRAVRAARPNARLIADANESWTKSDLTKLCSCAQELEFELIEQPVHAGDDVALRDVVCSVPICADESIHTRAELGSLEGLYQAVNIKLDKAGGLTEALLMLEAAKVHGFKVMIGSMVSTSLAIAPALLLASSADWVDLDGPLLLERDREFGVSIEDGWIMPPSSELWG